MHKPEFVQENETNKATNGSHNYGQKTRPSLFFIKKRLYRFVDFAVSADHGVKIKDSLMGFCILDLFETVHNILM